MPFCGRCGEVLDVDAKFCPNCGTPVRQEPMFDGEQCQDNVIDDEEYDAYVSENEKSGLTAAVLSFILPGVGHMYAGKFWEGVKCIILCIMIDLLLFAIAPDYLYEDDSILYTYLSVRFTYSLVFAAGSYSVVKKYNSELRDTGERPW